MYELKGCKGPGVIWGAVLSKVNLLVV